MREATRKANFDGFMAQAFKKPQNIRGPTERIRGGQLTVALMNKKADLGVKLQAEVGSVLGVSSRILNKSGRQMLMPCSACCHHNTSQMNER